MSDDQSQVIVIDNGTYTIKAGQAGDDAPSQVFEPLIREATFIPHTERSPSDKSHHVGNETTLTDVDPVLEKQLKRPIVDGKIIDFDGMERIWHHLFYNELRIAPEDFSFLITEHALNDRSKREWMTQTIFETFNGLSCYVANDAVMSLYASGRTIGVVTSCGEELSEVVPIFEGIAMTHAVKRINLGGKHLTDRLATLISQRGYSYDTNLRTEREIVRNLKEKLCYVPLDYDEEMGQYKNKDSCQNSFELPDGNNFTIDSERFNCPEALFQPGLVGLDVEGIHIQTYQSIQKLDIDGRRFWYSNMLLTGASTLFEGLNERMRKEMVSLSPSSMAVKVVAPQERKYSTWIGGSILGSMSLFEQCAISKDEYDEWGPTMVNRKCF